MTLTGVAPTTIGSSANETEHNEAIVLDDTTPAISRATGPVASTPGFQRDPKPILSVAAISGAAVGGAVLLTLIVGLVAWILRRHKRNIIPRAVSRPSYQAADTKESYYKPELDSHVLAYQYSKAEVAAPAQSPVVYVELDGSGRSSHVRELSRRS